MDFFRNKLTALIFHLRRSDESCRGRSWPAYRSGGFTLIESDSFIQSRRDNNKSAPAQVGVYMNAVKATKAFTLIELLIVLSIIAILGTAAVIILNPAELLSEARDADRISAVKSLYQGLSLLKNSDPEASLGLPKTVYISLSDDAGVACPSYTSSLPSLPSGWSYRCAPSVSLRNVDGTGWLPINFLSVLGGSPLPVLPIDPQNGIASGRYYMYIPDGTAFAAPLESAKYLRQSARRDGGYDLVRYEIGRDLSVFAIINRLAGLWSLDGSADDSGISGNNGTVFGSPSVASGVSGVALSFDGVDDYIRILNQTGDTFSVSFWLKAASSPSGAACSDGSGLIASDIQGIGNDFSVTLVNNHACFFTGNPDESVEGTRNVADNAWHHVVISRERGGLKSVYVDGSLDSAGLAGNNVLNNNQNIEFGASTITGKYFAGALDEIVVYNRLLTQAEISALSVAGFK